MMQSYYGRFPCSGEAKNIKDKECECGVMIARDVMDMNMRHSNGQTTPLILLGREINARKLAQYIINYAQTITFTDYYR